MACLTNEELQKLFLGQLDDETTTSLYAHIAICDQCCERYSQIAEQNIVPAPKDFSSAILSQIQKGPITRKKLLAIYAVAAACFMLLMTSGTIDKMFTITQQLQIKSTEWSEKITDKKINQFWEENNHGIQN